MRIIVVLNINYMDLYCVTLLGVVTTSDLKPSGECYTIMDIATGVKSLESFCKSCEVCLFSISRKTTVVNGRFAEVAIKLSLFLIQRPYIHVLNN